MMRPSFDISVGAFKKTDCLPSTVSRSGFETNVWLQQCLLCSVCSLVCDMFVVATGWFDGMILIFYLSPICLISLDLALMLQIQLKAKILIDNIRLEIHAPWPLATNQSEYSIPSVGTYILDSFFA